MMDRVRVVSFHRRNSRSVKFVFSRPVSDQELVAFFEALRILVDQAQEGMEGTDT